MHPPELQDLIEILLVEDNDPDALLLMHAIGKARRRSRLHRVADGYAALDFLRRQGEFTEAPRPHLILLDLHLPKRTGREVLEVIKRDMDLRTIPVLVLTASKSAEDVLDVYTLHANCFINKPVGPEGFARIVQAIEDFWFGVVTLPCHEESANQRGGA